jgi:hypothetical protein
MPKEIAKDFFSQGFTDGASIDAIKQHGFINVI